MPYSHPLRQERQILKELATQGFDEAAYKAALERFIRSDYGDRRTLAAGFTEFLALAATFADISLVTTVRYGNTVASVRDSLRTAGLTFHGSIAVTEDSERVPMLCRERIAAYFDDRPELLHVAAAAGLFTVHVNDPHLTQPAGPPTRFFDCWPSAVSAFEALKHAILTRVALGRRPNWRHLRNV